MLSEVLLKIPDYRRGQGKKFKLAPILHMSILAMLSNATSYRQIYTFIYEGFSVLKKSSIWIGKLRHPTAL